MTFQPDGNDMMAAYTTALPAATVLSIFLALAGLFFTLGVGLLILFFSHLSKTSNQLSYKIKAMQNETAASVRLMEEAAHDRGSD